MPSRDAPLSIVTEPLEDDVLSPEDSAALPVDADDDAVCSCSDPEGPSEPAPVDTDTEPPGDAPPLEPGCTTTSPPEEVNELPASSEMTPAWPAALPPVETVTPPLEPRTDDPV